MGIRAALAIVALAACGGRAFESHDAGADADPDAGFVPTVPEPPALPRTTPCPTGWREVVDEGDPPVAYCDPWPEGGPADCGVDEMHLPGGAGCERIGTSCPAGDYADDLPEGATIRYVLAGAVGGDGTIGSPFGSIRDAIGASAAGDVVALSKGTFDEVVVLSDAVTVWGACVAETVVAPSEASDTAATLQFNFAGAVVKNLRVSGPRTGAIVRLPGSLEDVVFDGTRVTGLYVWTDFSATNVAVRDTGPSVTDEHGESVVVLSGATLDLSRAEIRGGHTVGLFVLDSGSRVHATDVVVRDILAEPTGWFGNGVNVQNGGTLEASRLVVEDVRSFGVRVKGEGASAVLDDVLVRGVARQESDTLLGHGVGATEGGVVDVRSALVEDMERAGLIAGTNGTLLATDTVVRATRSAAVQVYDTSRMELRRTAVVHANVVGIVLRTDSEVVATDLVVRDTGPDTAGGLGDGIELYGVATLTIERGILRRNRRLGLLARDTGTVATLSDVVIEGTIAKDCDGCIGFGTGLASAEGASVIATRFEIAQNVLCGVQVAFGGTADLSDGVVAENAIGVNLQTPGFDIARLQDRVIFRDNGTALDSSELPVPDAGGLGE